MFKSFDEKLKDIKVLKDLVPFQALMLIFQTARQWSHTKYEVKKAELIKQRVAALRQENMPAYVELVG